MAGSEVLEPSVRSADRARLATVPIAWVQLGVILAILAGFSVLKPVDPDFWWHLATGNRILDGHIPTHDPYSWTAAGRPWIAHEWLSEAVLARVQSWFGYAGNLLLFNAAVVGAILTMFALARKLGAGARMLVVLTFLCSFVLVFFPTVRPQVFSWLLFAVFAYILTGHERRNSRALWLLVPLMALWVNLHLGFVYGLMLLGLWFASRLLRRIRGEEIDILVPTMVTAASVVATFLNPAGPEILLYPVRYYSDRESLRVVAEWKSPLDFNVLWSPYYLALILVLFALAKRRTTLYVTLVTVAVVALSLSAVRNMPFLALMLIPVGGVAFSGSAGAKGRQQVPSTRLPLALALPLVAGTLLTLAVMSVQARDGGVSFGDPSDDRYPAAGAAWIESHAPDARLFNDYTWGGYLIYRLPSTPVFIDGRTDFYRSRIMGDYIAIGRLEDGWDAKLDAYGVDTVLTRKESRLAKRLRETQAWEEAFTGDLESVFVRRR